MKIISALIIFVYPLFIFAKDDLKKTDSKKTISEQDGYQTLDMNQFKGLDSNQPPGESKIKFSGGCKSKGGLEYKIRDAGYESCLREIEMDHSMENKNGAGRAAGFTIGK